MITANPNPAAHAGEDQASNPLAAAQVHWEHVESGLLRALSPQAARLALQSFLTAAPAEIGGAA